MSLGLIGRKIGMSQVFDKEGKRLAVTVVEAGPCPIVEVKRKESHGYDALRLSFEPVKEKKLTKAVAGEYKKGKLATMRKMREFRAEIGEEHKAGETLDVQIFAAGEEIKVVAVSKGKGFQGGMKRHGFSGGPASHGSKFHRALGSTGMHTKPGRVEKGRKMAGQMGNKAVTLPRVTVVDVLGEQNVLLVRGSVPGGNGNLLYLEKRAK